TRITECILGPNPTQETRDTLAACIPAEPSLSAALQCYRAGGQLFDASDHLQRTLTRLAEAAQAARLRTGGTLSPLQLALLQSNRSKWANAWLVAIPATDKPWLTLPDPHCRLAMRLRLGLHPQNVPSSPCVCGES